MPTPAEFAAFAVDLLDVVVGDKVGGTVDVGDGRNSSLCSLLQLTTGFGYPYAVHRRESSSPSFTCRSVLVALSKMSGGTANINLMSVKKNFNVEH